MSQLEMCGRMKRVLLVAGLSIASWTVAGCSHSDSAYPVASAGQGGVVVREEKGAPRPPREVAQPTGPTEKEIAQQKKIEELEAQSRALQEQSKQLQAEIQRLKGGK